MFIAHFREWCHAMRRRARERADVLDVRSACNEGVRNERAVTAPRDCFCAHDGHAPVFGTSSRRRVSADSNSSLAM